ncbi:sensor histidine kinase [Paenibacillus polysaccharolyticus]|jgi:signal transduction histidine kinase|uniref:sensor histidine kinase n=1 Tax=Paenibacillus polysaccharolyticus TaxID=582692 RepID=UPI001649960B|nr:HAMP domain-containing sensor histidine kinase [Paenibacillus polysaccharolyticus]
MLFVYILISVGQLTFFEDFYYHHKVNKLINNLSIFARHIERGDWNEEQLIEEYSVFLNENKSQVAILDTKGNYQFDNPFKLELQTQYNGVVDVPLYMFSDKAALKKAELHKGDKVTVKGLYQYEGNKVLFYPSQIRKEGGSAIGRRPEYKENSLVELTGVVHKIVSPSPDQWNMREGVLNFGITNTFPLNRNQMDRLQEGEVLVQKWREAWSDGENIVVMFPIKQENGVLKHIVFAVSSLAQIEESYDALKIYYLYIAIIALVLIPLISVFFSRTVSKPLLMLRESANKMARLDFSNVSTDYRNDEFGEVACSLNTLATKLDNTLQELQRSNQQLHSDIQQKERLEQLQKEFISNISHELKTPLSIVQSYAEGARDLVDQSNHDEYLSIIIDESDKMDRLIRQMTQLVKYDSDMFQLHIRTFSIKDLTERILDKFHILLKQRELNIQIKYWIQDRVKGDPEQIEHVIFNILSNSIRHAEPGSVIVIDMERTLENKLQVSVKNTGDHIPEEHLHRVWERFYQVEPGRSRESGGNSGLGLAIVKHLLDAHGSNYGIFNVQNGVIFSFTLELSDEKNQENVLNKTYD